MAKVQVEQGILIGAKSTTDHGVEFFEFLQVPYAEPPVGNMRFKSPQPPISWNGERDATKVDVNNIAPQINITNKFAGSEDCLYLNVFTPQLSLSNSNLLPVIVFFHGGGFILGAGILKDFIGISQYLEQNIVCVCINYRLGAFGFLSLDIPEAAGNMGLKDQVAALKWVQKNILAFSGDKTNVTLAGMSAGAACGEYHILSQSSKGLFSKCILQSGSALNHWALQCDFKKYAMQLASNLGYRGSTDDIPEVYTYLMKQPTRAIVEETHKIEGEYDRAINLIFVPSVEKDFGNGESFLTRLPYEILKEGKFNRVPVLRGFTEYEGSFTQATKSQTIRMLEKMTGKKNFSFFWKYPLSCNDIEIYNEKFNSQYFNEMLSSDDEKWAAIEFFGDYDFTAGIITSSKMIAHHGVPVYCYIYAFNESISIFESLNKIERRGAGHCDEMAYCLNSKIEGWDFKFTESDELMKRKMTKMWVNFAETGNPTSECNDDVPIQWPIFTNDEQNYMVIDKILRLRTGYRPERISIFEEIYEKYYK